MPWPKGKTPGPFKGRTHSVETRRKLSEIARIQVRKPHTAETRRKLREIARGRVRLKLRHSEETKKRISETVKKHFRNPENRRKISKEKKKWWKTPENRRKRCVAAKKRMSEPIRHHINFNRSDNRLENIYVFPNQEKHMRFHNLIRRLGLVESFKNGNLGSSEIPIIMENV